MSELSAAIGLVQLGRLPGATARRRENAHYLRARLEGVRCPSEPAGRQHVYHQFTVRADAARRDELRAWLAEQRVDARIYYPRPIHAEPALRHLGGATRHHLPETERAAREVLSLPVHPGLNAPDLERIVCAVNSFRLRAAR